MYDIVPKKNKQSYNVPWYFFLIIILRKLDNVEVLDSLFEIHNYHFHDLIQSNFSTNTLDFSTKLSNLTQLLVDLCCFNDYLRLLDGRFEHLSILNVKIASINNFSSINYENSIKLKSFSFTCYDMTNTYDGQIVLNLSIYKSRLSTSDLFYQLFSKL